MWQQTFSPKDVAANLLLQNMRQHTYVWQQNPFSRCKRCDNKSFKMQKVWQHTYEDVLLNMQKM